MMARRTHSARSPLVVFVVMLSSTAWLAGSADLLAQTLSVGSQRPFVTAIVPVVGPGAVGGVLIDADGVVSRADVDATDRLRDARLRALQQLPADLTRSSELRKVSLRGLEAAITQRREKGLPVSEEMQNLAGLQRIRYVFVDPERHDIVLAGPAEGWKIDAHGNAVGESTEQPVLQLDDLVAVLQTAEQASQTAISCSIDPTAQGVGRLRRLTSTKGLQMSRETVAKMESALGPQQVTVTGVAPSSHFARVMVAADFSMKRLAMHFERSPVDGLPSYMSLLKSATGRAPRNMTPRWWLEPRYESIVKDPQGLAFELRGSAVVAKTQENADLLAKKWAELLTEKYASLAAVRPVFAELRNCMDLAVVAALIVREDLPAKAGYDMPLLTDPKQVQPLAYHVPKTLASQASYFKKGREWVISVSGGVAINSWAMLQDVKESETVAATPQPPMEQAADRWWWD